MDTTLDDGSEKTQTPTKGAMEATDQSSQSVKPGFAGSLGPPPHRVRLS